MASNMKFYKTQALSLKGQIRALSLSLSLSMAKSVSSVVSLLVFLVGMGLANMAFGHSIAGSLQASVMIYNEIAVGSPIEVRCRSRRNEVVITETTLQSGERVGWGFQRSIWGHTRFNCDFKWVNRFQHFDVWVDAPLLDFWGFPRPCTHCVWHVVLDGFKEYESTDVLGTTVAHYPWRTGG